MTTFKAALIQLRSSTRMDVNLESVAALVAEAAGKGAQYIQTPEMTSVLNRDRDALLASIGTEETDAALAAFKALAARHQVWLHIGSQALRVEGAERVANRGFVIAPDGSIRARYDKIHMFDVDLPNGESWRESAVYQPGEQAVIADLPWGRLGFGICYDVRFPHLAHSLAQKEAAFLSYPAAFTRQTGEAHWHVLLRARAIETGSFVFAAAQGGLHQDGRETFGHSLIVDPWGRVLAEGGSEPSVIWADIDVNEVVLARQRIPALRNTRSFAAPA